MPKPIPAHIALRDQLRTTITDTIILNTTLETLIAVKTREPSERFHGKIDHSQPPWHAPVANAILDLHCLARQMEKNLRVTQGLPLRPRGGSGNNTIIALENVSRLCENADDTIVKLCTRDLESWVRQALSVMKLRETPRRLPRQAGEGEKPCPWCKNNTLRMLPLRGEIRCINPACMDDQEKRPRARLEYSPHVRDFVMVWQDNLIGVP